MHADSAVNPGSVAPFRRCEPTHPTGRATDGGRPPGSWIALASSAIVRLPAVSGSFGHPLPPGAVGTRVYREVSRILRRMPNPSPASSTPDPTASSHVSGTATRRASTAWVR